MSGRFSFVERLASALLRPTCMEKVSFRPGDLIMLDGLYGCSDESCGLRAWGTSGRRFIRLACGHQEWTLIRRRMDNWW
jgi:hypothetical protein